MKTYDNGLWVFSIAGLTWPLLLTACIKRSSHSKNFWKGCEDWTVKWPRRLVAIFLPQRPTFNPRRVHVEFDRNRVAGITCQ